MGTSASQMPAILHELQPKPGRTSAKLAEPAGDCRGHARRTRCVACSGLPSNRMLRLPSPAPISTTRTRVTAGSASYVAAMCAAVCAQSMSSSVGLGVSSCRGGSGGSPGCRTRCCRAVPTRRASWAARPIDGRRGSSGARRSRPRGPSAPAGCWARRASRTGAAAGAPCGVRAAPAARPGASPGRWPRRRRGRCVRAGRPRRG